MHMQQKTDKEWGKNAEVDIMINTEDQGEILSELPHFTFYFNHVTFPILKRHLI